MSIFNLKYDVSTSAPTISRFHRSNHPFRIVCGPIGGGKSVACCVEIFRRCQEQVKGVDGYRRSRWVVVRNTRGQLKDTTLKTWFDWFPPDSGIGHWAATDATFYFEFGDVKAEILFRALDTPADVAKVLSLELTGAWLNECREIPQEIVESLQGRLERYPSVAMGGSNYWMLICDTNPPEEEGYWWKLMEGMPLEKDDQDTIVDCDVFKQPSGLSPEAENTANLNPGYYTTKAKGRSKAWIDVYIKAQYAVSQSGRPVYHKVFRKDVHVSKSHLQPEPYLPVIASFDCGLCYDKETEVLTASGWKLFKDVDPAIDMVATRNPDTKQMEYVLPNFKVEMPYKGEMLGWRSTEMDMLVTPEHRIPVTNRETPDKVFFRDARFIADNPGKHLYVDLLSSWVGNSFDPPCGLTMEQYALLLGWIASDGSIDKNTNRVSIAQVKPHDDLVELLASTPISWGKYGINYTTTNKELNPHICAEWGRTKKERRVSPLIKGAPVDIIRMFLHTFTRGDGCVRKRKNGAVEWVIYSSTLDLAGDLQELIQKAGWSSSLRTQYGQTSYLDGREIVSSDGYIVTVKRRASRAEFHRRNAYSVEYDDFVYCLNVPHHTLYVRRGGKPHWNGNTPAATFRQMGLDGRIRVLREAVEFDMGMKRFAKFRLRPIIKNFFPTNPLIFVGDPAGKRRADSDESKAFDMLKKEFEDDDAIVVGAATNDPTVRIQATEDALSQYPNGEPLLLIDPSCTWYIAALQNKYRYAKRKLTGDYASTPEKNEWSHIAEAGQYGDMFLLSPKYDPKDYAPRPSQDDIFPTTRYRPAQKEGY